MGINGIYLTQPAADILTIIVCVLSVKSMKIKAEKNMQLVGSPSPEK